MSDRGMKKWAPYKSLPEHDPKFIELKKKNKKIEKPLISSEIADEINNILQNYHHQLLKIKYYSNGEILFIETTIKKIDIDNKILLLDNGQKICFNALLYIQII